jgi:hypothetical protein
MIEVIPGDLILSFCDTEIKAVGVASAKAVSAEKPNFGAVGDYWDNEGWLVPVEFKELKRPVRPKDFINELLPHFRGKYDPLQANGNGNQGVYLAEISRPFFETILVRCGHTASDFIGAGDVGFEAENMAAQSIIEDRTDIGETQKRQLILARRGQGVFKANVRLNEPKCRLTGVTDPRLLIASHIKPWARCSDREKLDGCNGLLLSPHADRLFDRGFISFTDDGLLITSPDLDHSILSSWGIDYDAKVGPFSPEQASYLDYHRNNVFRSSKSQ